MQLAVVSETWPPEVNGVARTAARFVEELRAAGHDIQLVRPRQNGHDVPEHSAGLRTILRPGMPIPLYANLRIGLPAASALVRLWTLRRPDVVHIITEGPLGWSALRAAEKLELPVVSDFRTNFHAYSAHYGLGWLERPVLAYLRKFHNRTATTLVPTEAMRAELAGRGFQRLRVIARGVDTRLFDPVRRDERLRARWGAAPSDPVLLYVGRLAAEKNLQTVSEAFAAAAAANPRARIVLVGDGPARRELEARFPGAYFAGTRSGADLGAHYASADIFVFPSLTETYGNVTLEAMASGLAVVAYDYAAAAALIRHGVSGLLVPLEGTDFPAQAAALALDPARARRRGESARRAALRRGWQQVADELEAVLLAAAVHVSANEPPAIRAPSAAPASTSLG